MARILAVLSIIEIVMQLTLKPDVAAGSSGREDPHDRSVQPCADSGNGCLSLSQTGRPVVTSVAEQSVS